MGQNDVVQGTLEMLILKTLALEPMHGYGMALRIEQVSQEFAGCSARNLWNARWTRNCATF